MDVPLGKIESDSELVKVRKLSGQYPVPDCNYYSKSPNYPTIRDFFKSQNYPTIQQSNYLTINYRLLVSMYSTLSYNKNDHAHTDISIRQSDSLTFGLLK